MNYQSKDRRPIPMRERQASRRVAQFLIRLKFSANAISVGSVIFGGAAGICLAITADTEPARLLWAAAAFFILLRLLANMFDGMVALETGKASATGELFNEIPDRISDAFIFVGAGFAANSSIHLGYAAAILAILVAYIRTLGNEMNVTGLFIGPMSKQQRMFLVIAICVFYAFAPDRFQGPSVILWGLWVIIAGSIVTGIRRIRHISRSLKS